MKKKILFIFGTRPEAIKLASVIKEFYNKGERFKVLVCITSQHKEMLYPFLDFFKIKADFNLNLMKPAQSLFEITSKGLINIESVLDKVKPDIIFVQGDTSSAFVGALAGYYKRIKVAHIEAGLRSFNKFAPFPEEMNRVLISHIADYHFAPTLKEKKNLEKEGIKDNVYVVGNTIVDVLFYVLDIIERENTKYNKFFKNIDFSKKVILLTVHRRENFGNSLKEICNGVRKLAKQFKNEIEIVFPVHLNPYIRKEVFKILGEESNIHLMEPLNYPYFIWLLKSAHFVLTDSGGIQEEAPYLGKPVLVIRDVTERLPTGIGKKFFRVIGRSSENIIKESEKLIYGKWYYNNKRLNLFGDGKASKRIGDIVEKIL
jgi:UDP-N-acetylglucosamine 2-epimerase (non-hydrolysing)